jgi:hypothetical protein
MIRKFLGKLTKGFIAFAVIAASLVILLVWKLGLWPFRGWGGGLGSSSAAVRYVEPAIKGRESQLLLVDKDIYDAGSGELLAKGWLHEEMPVRIYFDSKAKKFIARYAHGFARLALNGKMEAQLPLKTTAALSDDFKWMVFAKDREVWRANVDWNAFKRVNEKKLTSIEQFIEGHFAENILLGTDKTLIVRNGNNHLRVNLETGDVKPVRVNLGDFVKRRSPDSKSVVGIENGQFYCYDVDSEDAMTVQVGRGVMNDYQWLGNDRCLAIAGGKTVVLYNRPKNTLTPLAPLPLPCTKIGEPSPDGRFVFCIGSGSGVLVDVEKKTATPVAGGAGIFWINNDTFAYSREVPNSELRGTWLQTVGEGERRVSPDPYLVRKSGPQMMTHKSAGMVIFSTKHGLSKMKPDGTGVEKFGKLAGPPSRVIGIQEWKQ